MSTILSIYQAYVHIKLLEFLNSDLFESNSKNAQQHFYSLIDGDIKDMKGNNPLYLPIILHEIKAFNPDMHENLSKPLYDILEEYSNAEKDFNNDAICIHKFIFIINKLIINVTALQDIKHEYSVKKIITKNPAKDLLAKHVNAILLNKFMMLNKNFTFLLNIELNRSLNDKKVELNSRQMA